jgi:pilus assembly protein CpaB
VILLVSVVLAAACAGGVYVYLKHVPQAQAAEEKLPVVVASRDVTFGTKLGPEHLRVVQYPKDALPKGYYSSPDSVLSRSTRVFVMQGEAILASKLSSVGGGLSLRIPDNMRAISLSVNEITGVNGFVLPGDRVDVLVTVDYVDGTNNSVTKIILQNVEVLASGSKTETKQNQQITTQTMTLLVDPKGAEMVALGQHQGHVHVVLRNPEDAKIVDAKPTDTRDVLSLRGAAEGAPKRVAAPKPTPPPAPEPPPSFTIIRNGTITTQSQPETKK